ncbi:MAG TPA: serine/threonine-protein kinase [Acidimicrobiales bacterium]|nr:serine/threonine-protein kinase [Acidimicrobiales bacterium]
MTYDLIARLGRGGMGVVDLARDDDGNKVALKRLTLQGSAADIARSRERLLREAAVLRKLHHPNVVGLLDVIDEGDEIVLVMPYLAGGSLAERVAQHGPAPADEVERQARRLLGALASAHAAGIVHRDIKPANVLFDDRGEPCLADFGVALSHDQTHGLTVAGMVVGTPGFMAPEQARGEAVSPATDVFSLGATLLFAATGDGPYGQGDPGLLMVRAAAGKVEKVPKHLPPSLRKLLRAMLDPRAARRPAAAALAGPPVRSLSLPHPTAGGWGWAAAGLVAAALAAGAVAWGARDAVEDGTAPADVVEEGTAGPEASGGACVDLPYQPCGQAEPAPFTDGTTCIDDHDDYDGNVLNGCEAEPDTEDGRPLVDVIEATIVPFDDVDTYVVAVKDELQTTCDGTIVLTLEAPPGIVLGLEVHDRAGGIVGQATSVNDTPAQVALGEERCGGDETMLDVIVYPVGEQRVAAPYRLAREGSF